MKSAEKVVLYRLAASLLLTASTLHLLGLPAFPHGGGLDKYGCHHNRVHGNHHCHRGAFKGAMFDSQAEMLQALEASAPAAVQEFTGKVVGVSDGGTITVLHNGKGERIRLHGIDSPEKRQAFGNRAKQFTSKLVFGKTVTVEVMDRDRYGRTLGVVLLPDGRSLDRELVRAGFAWWYRRYAPDDETPEQLEREARGAELGLWADPHAVPPWEWRKMRKSYR